jgi:hypothetical protein
MCEIELLLWNTAYYSEIAGILIYKLLSEYGHY